MVAPEGSDDVLTELKLQFDSADGQVREGKVTLHAEGSLTSDEALRPLQIGLYWVEAGDVFLGASSVSNRVRMPSPGPDGHVRWSSRTTLILGRNMTGWLYAAVVNGQTLKTTTLVPNETGQDVRAHRRRFDLGQLRHAPRLLKRMGRELAREADEGLCSVARSGCYLTSVCCGMVGLADDCLELRVLRRFRDGWLRQQPGGPAEIDEYRRIAPRIAAALWTAPDAAGQGRRIYLRFILPSVLLILCGQRRRAWMRYRQMVRDLERTCGPRA